MNQQHQPRLQQAIADVKHLTAHIEAALEAEEPDFNNVSITFDQLKDAAQRGWLTAYKIHFGQV